MLTQNNLPQDSTTGNYYITYQPTVAPAHYSVQFYLNGILWTSRQFQFELINSYLDVTYSSATLLGYGGVPQQDCVFVKQPFYVRIDMQDIFANNIPYNDISAFDNTLTASLTSGVIYEIEDCTQFQADHPYSIICSF